MSQAGHIEYRVDAHIATITFNRPKKKNAFTHAMYEQFAHALAEADQDPTVRAVVIAGSGNAFSAGNDLTDFMHNPPTNGSSPVWKVIRGLVFAEKPLIAAVEGAAVGIGTTMLLHCDMVCADSSARFTLPFVDLALTPEAGSSLLLPAIAGMQRASRYVLLGESFGAEEAASFGMVTHVTDDGKTLEAANALAERIAKRPPGAVRAAKRLLREPIRRRIEPVLQDEGATFVTCLGSPEAHEAFSAFFEKRAPDFSSF